MTRTIRRTFVLVAALTALGALALSGSAAAGSAACAARTNNTLAKLTECVTLEGVRGQQAALQAIADANGGIRTSGTPGYDASAAYVAGLMAAAGYQVTLQEFTYNTSIRVGPSVLAQVAPASVTYVEAVDFQTMDQSEPGDVTAAVTAVDLQLGLGNASTSGCEATDFAGFPAGNIALVQRGFCTFQLKAENAAAAGAVGVVIFNQGNTPGRTGLINGTLTADYVGGIPVMDATYARGEEWAGTPGLQLRLFANVFRGEASTVNVLAETPGGNPNNVIMVGAHLDSVDAGPGINDNGSGSAAILETALMMAKVNPWNKVRFAWWGAEEASLVGSTYYVDNLSQGELDRITLYLNFDMVGSPNHVFFVYDGDNSDGVGAGPGPEGSAQIEKTFEAFYSSRGLPFKGTDFDGRSDYGPFIAAGVPAGGLFTGAEGIKTPAEVSLWGGTAGQQYDPCYHLACDTYANVNESALDTNSDAIATATLSYAMSTTLVNGERGKGNFTPPASENQPVGS